MPCAIGQQAGAVAHHAWGPGPGVDDGVPFGVAQRPPYGLGVGAVGDQRPYSRDGVAAEAAVERAHLIAALQRGLHEGAAHVVGAAEDEDSHDAPEVKGSQRADGC